MVPQNGQERIPGTFTTLEFPITASVVLGIAAVLAIILFVYCPKDREAEKFGIEAITLTAGALSAYYIGQGLKETVIQREESLKGGRIAVSCRFIERWNSPQTMAMKQDFREIIDSGKAHTAQFVEDLLERDKAKRTTVVEVLNFFEEASLSANKKLADDETLRAFFKGMLNGYYATLSPWIKAYRASTARPMMWIELERMHTRWENS
jgi:Domain of unknown function (DUF4760)